jgi:hypothetical protein
LFLGERAKGVDSRIDLMKARIDGVDEFDRRHSLGADGRTERGGRHETEILADRGRYTLGGGDVGKRRNRHRE